MRCRNLKVGIRTIAVKELYSNSVGDCAARVEARKSATLVVDRDRKFDTDIFAFVNRSKVVDHRAAFVDEKNSL